MSLSEALGPYPVIHHFYPIDPETAAQQQAAVYNEPDFPLVAPIIPIPAQHPQHSRAKKPRKILSKAKSQVLKSDKVVSPSNRRKMATKRSLQSSHRDISLSRVYLAPQIPRQTVHVEIPGLKSLDRASYRPFNPNSSSLYLPLGRSKATRALSPASGKSYDPDSDSNPFRYNISINAKRRTSKKRQRFTNAQAIPDRVAATDQKIEVDEATTCHQCRRKTTREKMSCRNLLSNGSVCSFHFCKVCIEVRYDEPFVPFHRTWHCPRCRGICNCSICLRKAGYGYILDGPASEEFTGTQGRLSVAKKRKTKNGKGNVENGAGESGTGTERGQITVQTWLARKGIALGSEAWMEEQCKQGVRFVVGMSPPPLGVPSPYMEARLNPTLDAWENALHHEAADENDDVGFPMAGGDGRMSPRRVPELSALDGGRGTSNLQATGTTTEQSELADRDPAVNQCVSDSTMAETHDLLISHLSPSQMANMGPPPLPHTPTEDFPGLSSVETRCVRLFVGKPRPKKRSRITKRKKGKRTQAHAIDLDYDSVSTTSTGVKSRIRSIRAGRRNLTRSPRVDANPEAGVMIAGSLSNVDYDLSFPYKEEALTPPPPPPPEPVLVPTEVYTPLKLDATCVKDSNAQFGHSYWSLNAFNSHSHDQELELVRDKSPSPFRQLPPRSYTELYHNPYFSPDDSSSPGSAKLGIGSGSGSTSHADVRHSGPAPMLASSSRAPDDYSTPRINARENGYVPCGLPPLVPLEDTWTASGSMDMDVPPLQMEGVARAVHESLKSAGVHGGSY